MLPRTPANFIPFSVTTPRHTAPKRRSKFGGAILSFASPVPPTQDPLCASHVVDHPQPAGSGSSHQPSSIRFRPPVTCGSQEEPQLVGGRQESQDWSLRGSARGDSEGPMGSRLDADSMLATPHSPLTYMNIIYLNSSVFGQPSAASNIESRSVRASVRVSRTDKFGKVLALLRDGNLSPFDLVLEILDDCNPEYTGYRVELYKDGNRKLPQILDSIIAVHTGRAKLLSWMRPHALELVCGVIDEEMDSVNKADLLPGLAAITPDFIQAWTVSNLQDRAPFLMEILLRAAETSLAKEKNKIKCPDAVRSAPVYRVILILVCAVDV
jgi:hypothetical protein